MGSNQKSEKTSGYKKNSSDESSKTAANKSKSEKYKPASFVEVFSFKCGFVAVMTVSMFILCIGIYLYLSAVTYPEGEWIFESQPIAHEFHEFGISSSSEICNELTRIEALNPEATTMTLGAFMIACLNLAEPHSNGLGGSSHAMHVNGSSSMYEQSEGYHRIPSEVFNNMMNNSNSANEENQGPDSIAIPMHIQTMLWSCYKANSDDEKLARHEHFFALSYLVTDLGTSFPVSTYMAEAAKQANMDLSRLDHNGFVRSIMTEKNIKPMVGELFKPLPYPLELFIHISSSTSNNLDNTTVKEVTEFVNNLVDTINYLKELPEETEFVTVKDYMNLLLNVSTDSYEGIDLSSGREDEQDVRITDGNSYLFMSQGRQTIIQNSTVHRHALAMSVMFYKPPLTYLIPNSNLTLMDSIVDLDVYSEFLYSINVYYHLIQRKNPIFVYESLESEVNSSALYNDTAVIKKSSSDRKRWNIDINRKNTKANKYYGSYAAIVGRRSNTAFTYQGTLGSGFGSQEIVTDKENGYALNNLMAMLSSNIKQVWGNDYDFCPVVITRNDTIESVYVGPGAFLTRSLNFARLFQTLIFKIYYGIRMELAVAAPILTELPGKNIYCAEIFSWPQVYLMNRFFPKAKLVRKTDMLDEAAVIDGNTVMHFNRKDELVMPQVVDGPAGMA